jgi:hypothetical protein
MRLTLSAAFLRCNISLMPAIILPVIQNSNNANLKAKTESPKPQLKTQNCSAHWRNYAM